jgi:hypothetical protein
MAALVEFLGQTIMIGEVVGDICVHDSAVLYSNAPTMFDPIQYMQEHGGIPREDTTYNFYAPEVTGDSDPCFAFHVNYSGDRFRVGYTIRQYNEQTEEWYDWQSWSTGQSMNWEDTYIGVNPDAPTFEDSWRNAFWITRIGASTMPDDFYGTGRYGYVLGHKFGNDYPAVDQPGVGGYRLDEDVDPPTYVIDHAPWYSMFSNGVQVAYPDFGEGWKLMLTKLCRDVDGFDDDRSKPAGGYGGNYDFSSNFDGEIPLPNLSIIDSGLATLWTPTTGEFRSLVSYLWTDNFYDNLIKLSSDPIQNIIMAGLVPFSLNDYAGTAKVCKVGNVSTGVTMTPLTQQYIKYEVGSIKCPEHWKTALDYSPWTNCDLYLPFCGTFTLSPDEVIASNNIKITYYIDLFSGDFTAEVYIDKKMPVNGYIKNYVYEKSGNLMLKLPITGANYGRIYTQLATDVMSGISNLASGNVGGAVMDTLDAVGQAGTPPIVSRTGNYTGSSAYLGQQRAMMILTNPTQVLPDKYEEMDGFPSFITYKLGNLDGFTKVYAVHENKITGATESEEEEIMKLLKEGIYL